MFGYLGRRLAALIGVIVVVVGMTAGSASAAASAAGGSSQVTTSVSEFEEFSLESAAANLSTAVAGGHPDFTIEFALRHKVEKGVAISAARLERTTVSLPPGLIGNVAAFPRCSAGSFAAFANCPVDSQVGVVRLQLNEYPAGELLTLPVYNLELPHPEREVARLGFFPDYPAYIDVHVRTASDYGVTATVEDSPGQESVLSVTTTLWGDPPDPVHNRQRLTTAEAAECGADPSGTACDAPGGERSSGLPPTSFMTNPSVCGEGEIGIDVASYELPGAQFETETKLPTITGCEGLPFEPSLEVQPTSHVAGAPTGLVAKLRIPQHEGPEERATSTLRDATVTLPRGMTLAAGAANGLAGCSEEQVRYHQEAAAECPQASQLGTVTFLSPDLSVPLQGAIYQRSPEGEHLFRIWLVTDELGLHVKLSGEIHPDPATGQLTAEFTELPQLPVEEVDLSFWGGPNAPLANPDACGSYATSYQFTPWSGSQPLSGQTTMQIGEGCDTGHFAPRLSAGVADRQAGAYSPFLFTLTQESGEQNIEGLSATLPDGLLAKLAGVPLCSGTALETGDCSSATQVGSTTVAVGPGTQPLWIPQPGKAPTAVYLAGPYRGAPYSLLVKVPAQAGPFDLGDVLTRVALQVDPQTAQVTAVSDPLPQFLKGVPVQYRTIYISIDRPEFIFNPTNCETMQVTGTISSAQGASAEVSSPFQVAGCASLAFKPKFTASTSAKTSRADGASLTVKLTQADNGEANIHKAKVELPKSLPARISTLQKACTEKQFAADPAGCPEESIVGHAVVHTPILDNPLQGPAYFVSHGGAKFPELIMVLQSEGITIDLAGETFISERGVTSTTLPSVPDAPVSTFELTLPIGKYSALAANGDLCTQKLSMPTNFTAQNGATLEQRTPVEVENCPDTLSILSHHIKNDVLTLRIYAPTAGKLKISGKNLQTQNKTLTARTTLTIKTHEKHTNKPNNTININITFTPNTGKNHKPQIKNLPIKFKTPNHTHKHHHHNN